MSITGFNLRRRKLEEAKKAAELEVKRAEEAAALEAEKIALEKQEDPAAEDQAVEDPAIDYSSLKVEELKEIAKLKGLQGYSDLKKAELIEMIEKLG